MRLFEGMQKPKTPEPTMDITEMNSDAGVDSDIAKDPAVPGSASNEKEAEGNEEEESATHVVASEEDNQEEDANREDEEEEGKGGEANAAPHSSYIPSAPTNVTQPCINIVANIAMLSSNPATPMHASLPGPYLTHLSSSSVTPLLAFQSPDRFWTEGGSIPVLQGLFTDLLSDAIPPPFDMSMNWEEGEGSEANAVPHLSYIPSAPANTTQHSIKIALPANVAMLSPNPATPANIAMPTNIAMHASLPMCLPSMQPSAVIATPQLSLMASQGPYLMHLSSSSMTPPLAFQSSDRFWSEGGRILVLQDAISPPFDMSMNWNAQAGWTGYSSAVSHQTQTQPMSFVPYPPSSFNFGSQAGLMGYSAEFVQLPPTCAAPNIQSMLIQTLPAPPMQVSGPLATIQVSPAPPKPPTESEVINIPQHPSGSIADIEVSKGNVGRLKQKHIPSQHAQRDNAIGVVGKENSVPPVSKNEPLRGKKRVASGDAVNGQGVANCIYLGTTNELSNLECIETALAACVR
ncbi:hypothetical protein EV363DRAFT_1293919 [Boletus edulis]|nr:hypothetical protein EV363DRAFT_1293919 [Boletus edulis]